MVREWFTQAELETVTTALRVAVGQYGVAAISLRRDGFMVEAAACDYERIKALMLCERLETKG